MPKSPRRLRWRKLPTDTTTGKTGPAGDGSPSVSYTHLAVYKRQEVMTYLRPDSKSQVTIEYDEKTNRPLRVHTIVVSTQHDEFILIRFNISCA